jgi:hypothetical protein
MLLQAQALQARASRHKHARVRPVSIRNRTRDCRLIRKWFTSLRLVHFRLADLERSPPPLLCIVMCAMPYSSRTLRHWLLLLVSLWRRWLGRANQQRGRGPPLGARGRAARAAAALAARVERDR